MDVLGTAQDQELFAVQPRPGAGADQYEHSNGVDEIKAAEVDKDLASVAGLCAPEFVLELGGGRDVKLSGGRDEVRMPLARAADCESAGLDRRVRSPKMLG